MDAMYTAEALATGAGRNGHAAIKGSDLDFALAIPKEMGGSGNGVSRSSFHDASVPGSGPRRTGRKLDPLPRWAPRRSRSPSCGHQRTPAN